MTANHSAPITTPAVRDARGRFLPGHAHRWQPGVSGNPDGRKSGTVYLSEYINMMSHWPRPKIQAVIDDGDAPIMQVIAAQRLLAAAGDANGAGLDFDRIADRSEGRPRQVTDVNVHEVQVRRIVLEGVDPVRALPPVIEASGS